jgi:transcriptional regulator with XRE-family HTH domain
MSDRRTSSLDLKAIGARVRALRGTLLQDEFAPKIGISQGQLSKIESGKIAPTLEVLVRLANRFEKSLDWIVTGQDKR